MRNINAVLRTFLKCGRHLTAQYLLLNRWRTEATLLSAGHPGPVYVPVRGEPRIIEGRGDILGAFEKVVLDPLRMKVEEGDRFYMYTDGLVESGGPGRRKQGQQALLASCEARREQPPEEALDGIMSDLAVGAESASDDVVVLVLEV
jgi:sigma-B regulation protein RsbU (phosphoserine phosphatase)